MSAELEVKPQARSSRKISWDLIRAGCVVMVMVFHATFEGPQLHPELVPGRIHFDHQVGASLLLLVSAYFVCVTIGRGTALRYAWGRIARLMPAYFAAVAITFLVTRYLSPPGWFRPSWHDLGANELMLWNWFPKYPFIDGSYWTTPLQLMGFIMAALLYRSGKLGHGRPLRVVLWALVLIPILQWPYRISGPPELYRAIVDGFGFHRLHMFVAGIAIWMWSTKRMSHWHFGLLISTCLFAHALHTAIIGPDGSVHVVWGSWFGIAIGFAVIAIASRFRDWDHLVPRVTWRAIRWFAGISYGIYLMHQAIGYIVMRQLGVWHFGPTVQLAGMLVTGTLLGWALTKAVERPMQARLMKWYDAVADRWNASRRPKEPEPQPEQAPDPEPEETRQPA